MQVINWFEVVTEQMEFCRFYKAGFLPIAPANSVGISENVLDRKSNP